MGNIIKEEEKKKKLVFLIWSKSGMQRSLKATLRNGNSCWGHFAEAIVMNTHEVKQSEDPGLHLFCGHC